ncbi:MAG: tetratricopeptide repeat protein [Elusimicrobiota bacterium]
MCALFRSNKIGQGIDLIKSNKMDEALQFFAEIHTKEPKNVDAIIEIAKIYFKKNDISSCKNILLNAIELNLDKDNIDAILELTNHRMIASDKYLNNSPVFSPDGTKIVYTSIRNDTNGDNLIDNNDRAGLYMYDLYANKETELVSDKYHNSAPSFSPDGTKIVCLSARRDTNHDGMINHMDNPELCVIETSSGKESLYISGEWCFKHPTLSPDNRHLLFSGWRPGSEILGIYVWNLETGNTKRISPERFNNTYPTWCPEGKNILYTSWREDSNHDDIISIQDNSGIYIFDMEKNEEHQLVNHNYDSRFPHFSPDGKTILYLSRRRDTNNDGKIDSFDNPGIFVMNLKTRKESIVVSDDYFNLFPTFTHDSDNIVYLGSWRSGKKKVYNRDYFENKGVYMSSISSHKEANIVNEKYYGCRNTVASPSQDMVTYLSWRKKTNRGVYLAYLKKELTKDELKNIIINNFGD